MLGPDGLPYGVARLARAGMDSAGVEVRAPDIGLPLQVVQAADIQKAQAALKGALYDIVGDFDRALGARVAGGVQDLLNLERRQEVPHHVAGVARALVHHDLVRRAAHGVAVAPRAHGRDQGVDHALGVLVALVIAQVDGRGAVIHHDIADHPLFGDSVQGAGLVFVKSRLVHNLHFAVRQVVHDANRGVDHPGVIGVQAAQALRGLARPELIRVAAVRAHGASQGRDAGHDDLSRFGVRFADPVVLQDFAHRPERQQLLARSAGRRQQQPGGGVGRILINAGLPLIRPRLALRLVARIAGQITPEGLRGYLERIGGAGHDSGQLAAPGGLQALGRLHNKSDLRGGELHDYSSPPSSLGTLSSGSGAGSQSGLNAALKSTSKPASRILPDMS